MRRVVINQSNYLPWKGYFDLIHDADLFIFLDNVQYTTNDWRNRNVIKTPTGPAWLTVPIGRHPSQLVSEVCIRDPQWQRRHWKTLQQVYGRAPHFGRYAEFFEHVYLNQRWQRLSELNQFLIRHIAHDYLGIKTKVVQSADFPTDATGQERILALLKETQATHYLSGPAGLAYLDPALFAEAGITLEWKDYDGYPVYAQPFPPFTHRVSIVDLLFCVGPDAPDYVWGARARTASGGVT